MGAAAVGAATDSGQKNIMSQKRCGVEGEGAILLASIVEGPGQRRGCLLASLPIMLGWFAAGTSDPQHSSPTRL